MSRTLLWAGERLGRFAILLFALPPLLPLVVWLYFLDRHPLIVVAGGAVAIPAAMLACVLVIGMVFAGFRRGKTEGISRQSAPRLWQIWEGVAGERRAARTTILLSPDLNASIGEARFSASLADGLPSSSACRCSRRPMRPPLQPSSPMRMLI